MRVRVFFLGANVCVCAWWSHFRCTYTENNFEVQGQ